MKPEIVKPATTVTMKVTRIPVNGMQYRDAIVTVDFAEIAAAYLQRALNAKGKKVTAMYGAVVVQASPLNHAGEQ